jgi:SAM-dependent methyltransferase
MNFIVAQRLVELNRQFYQTFGSEFSATRGRIQPGVRKIINEKVDQNERILDLGCGNGNFAFALAESGFSGSYLGLDFSLPLLDAAAPLTENPRFRFNSADLTSLTADHRPLNEQLPITNYYSLITSFATLHHIPSRELRLNILRFVRANLAPGGRFIHSNWQFLNSEKLRRRIQSWEAAGFSDTDVDAGDFLLDWRSGGYGLRYAHHFSAEELSQMASETGFRAVESFLSDGESGDLGLYQIWTADDRP